MDDRSAAAVPAPWKVLVSRPRIALETIAGVVVAQPRVSVDREGRLQPFMWLYYEPSEDGRRRNLAVLHMLGALMELATPRTAAWETEGQIFELVAARINRA